VQVIEWKDSEMTYNVLMGTLNPTHPLTHCPPSRSLRLCMLGTGGLSGPDALP